MISIRVYGILINPNKQVLVSDEYIRGNYYTKFPGGGLEFGEGTKECLQREFLEEINLKIEVGDHIYTTDFFQMSAFNKKHQILSIYYFVHPLEDIKAPTKQTPFDFTIQQLQEYEKSQQIEVIRFIDWEQFSEKEVSLPIDKMVATMVKERY